MASLGGQGAKAGLVQVLMACAPLSPTAPCCTCPRMAVVVVAVAVAVAVAVWRRMLMVASRAAVCPQIWMDTPHAKAVASRLPPAPPAPTRPSTPQGCPATASAACSVQGSLCPLPCRGCSSPKPWQLPVVVPVVVPVLVAVLVAVLVLVQTATSCCTQRQVRCVVHTHTHTHTHTAVSMVWCIGCGVCGWVGAMCGACAVVSVS